MLYYKIALAVICAGGLAALICRRHHAAATAAGALSLAAGSLAGLTALAVEGTISVDAFFRFPVLILALAAAFYSPGYLAGHGSERANIYWFLLNFTVAAMLTVTLEYSWLKFLLAWEVMGLASAMLVMFDRNSEAARKAGWLYFAACHAGAALLMLFFLFPGSGLLPLILGLAGFGLKIGFPLLHIWLPEAHPAAPAPVSSLMSGAMIGLGFLGISRFVLPMCGNISHSVFMGWTLLALGICGALGGIIFALPQNNLKRLLAYSSIENMGLISIASGLALLGAAHGLRAMSFTALAGALIHMVNHALLKGGLFLGAGAVLKSTGTLDMDKLGGLLHHAPATGSAFVLNAAGICGLPPFNGFAGEFLIYYAAFQGVINGGTVLCVFSIAALAVIALTGGIAAAVFAKAVGAVFLGEPRSKTAAAATEVTFMMRIAQFALFVLSLMMTGAIPFILNALGAETELTLCMFKISGVSLGVTLLLMLLLLIQLFCNRRGVRRSCTWDCGYARPDSRMEYTGTAFTQPLSDFFNPVLHVKKQLVKPENIFPEKASLQESVDDCGIKNFWLPLSEFMIKCANRIHHLQSGSLHFYILLILLSVVGMLVYAMIKG